MVSLASIGYNTNILSKAVYIRGGVSMSKTISYRLKHVGINCENAEEANQLVKVLCALFNMEKGADNDLRVFVGNAFEVMKYPKWGTEGHIGLSTDDVEAAMADLSAKGIEFYEEGMRRDENGKINFVYLKQDFAGFAIHICN